MANKVLHTEFSKACHKEPEKILVYEYDGENNKKSFTYNDIYISSVVLAKYFITSGIKPNQTIAIILENRHEWISVYFAILFSGAIAVPLDPQSNLTDLEFFFKDADCQIMITSSDYYNKISDLLNKPDFADKKSIILNTSNSSIKNINYINAVNVFAYDDIINNHKNFNIKSYENNFPIRQSHDIASIVYTSGTTGRYKGVMLSHANLYANYDSLTHLNIPLKQQHFLSILPLHHTFPFMATLLVPALSQGIVTYLNDLKPTSLLKCLQENNISLLVGVPQLFYMLHNGINQKISQLTCFQRYFFNITKNFVWTLRYLFNINCGKTLFKSLHKNFGKNLQYLLSGGAKLDPKTARDFLKLGFNLIEGYGLTETSPVITFNNDKIHKMMSVGKTIPNVKIKITSTEKYQNDDKNHAKVSDDKPNSTQILKPFITGEIAIQGPNVMLGYYNQPNATNEVIIDNWFYTGDIGYLDNQGYLYITGRSKEIIVLSSGKNISPEELEHYYSNIPFIKELAITTIEEHTTTKLMAIVVPNVEYCKQQGKVDIYTNIKEELELKAKELPAYKRIMGFILTLEELPRTRLGKLRRFIIEQQYKNLLQKSTEQKSANVSMENSLDISNKIQTQRQQEKTLNNKQNTIEAKIVTIIEDYLMHSLNQKQHNIQTHNHLELDLGIESLSRIELITLIEQNFKTKIDLNSLNKIATVQELIDLVKQNITNLPTSNIDSSFDITNNNNSTSNQKQLWHNLLQQPISPTLTNNLVLNFNKQQTIAFNIYNAIIRIIAKICWRIQAQGIENIPLNQSVIFAPNHTSFLDGPIIAGVLPKNIAGNTFFVGLTDIFKKGLLEKLNQIMKIIPIDPGTELLQALQACSYVLNNQKNVCIFPEGARSIDGKLQTFKKGIGILIAEHNIPVIPVYINGAYEALPRTKIIPKFNKITVTFGKPYTKDELIKNSKIDLSNNNIDEYMLITKFLHNEIFNMSEQAKSKSNNNSNSRICNL